MQFVRPPSVRSESPPSQIRARGAAVRGSQAAPMRVNGPDPRRGSTRARMSWFCTRSLRALSDRRDVDLVGAVVAIPDDPRHVPAALRKGERITDTQWASKDQVGASEAAVDNEAVDELAGRYVVSRTGRA
jgi:hypothetical protein